MRVWLTLPLPPLTLSALTPSTVHAEPVVFHFTAPAAGGPLNGTVFPGAFTVDSAAVTAGAGPIVLTSFNVLGTILTNANDAFALSPSATFSAGVLTGIGGYGVLSTAWAIAIGDPADRYGLPASISWLTLTPGNGFSYGTDPSGPETFANGAVRQVTATPESVSFSILGLGLAALAGIRRGFTPGPTKRHIKAAPSGHPPRAVALWREVPMAPGEGGALLAGLGRSPDNPHETLPIPILSGVVPPDKGQGRELW